MHVQDEQMTAIKRKYIIRNLPLQCCLHMRMHTLCGVSMWLYAVCNSMWEKKKQCQKKQNKEAEQHLRGETLTDKTLSYICTLYKKARRLVKRRRRRKAKAVGATLLISLAPAGAVSGQHFQAPSRWQPGFQSQAPAGQITAVINMQCKGCMWTFNHKQANSTCRVTFFPLTLMKAVSLLILWWNQVTTITRCLFFLYRL